MKPNGNGRRAARVLPVTAWFTLDQGADEVARRSDVWSLLGWYHQTQVQPHLGLRGFFRRMWWRLSRQDAKFLTAWDRVHLLIQQEQEKQGAPRATAEPRPEPIG